MPELSTLGAVIKTAYEAEANTNAFTDAEKTKLSGVATGATVGPTLASTAPAALAAAADVGVGTTAARADHVHAFPAQLATGRTISLTGGATGTSAAFTGAANVSIAVTLATPTGSVRGGVLQGDAVADATDEASAVTQLNALLAALRTAGVIAAD